MLPVRLQVTPESQASDAAVPAHARVRPLGGARIVYNTTAGLNEAVMVNRTTRSWFNTTLSNGANWTQPYTFSIATIGLWKVQFLPYKDGDFSTAYRELHLYVTVT